MRDKLKIDFHVLFPFLVTLLLWVIFYFDKTKALSLSQYGVWPRSVIGLPGIITHFFIHGDFHHILSNTISFLVLALFLFIGYRQIAFQVFTMMVPLTGIFLWIGGRDIEKGVSIVHIGASGVIFALFGFLLLSGLIRKNKMMMSLTALVIFLYGYMIWGIFPMEKHVSWDGHLSGLITGCILAYAYRKRGPQADKFALLEEEEDEYDKLPEEEKYWLKENVNENGNETVQPQQNDQLFVNYQFVPKREKENGDKKDPD
jgi:membrane associated rhomboid family serine protease